MNETISLRLNTVVQSPVCGHYN